MRNVKFLFVLMVLLSAIVPFETEASESGISLNIRFFDRRVYRVSYDPIFIQITIANNSPSTYRFKLADDRVFSLDFDVRTATNRPLEQASQLIRRRTQSQQVFFREIAVEPGESFSFVEDLRNYVNIPDPGSFVVRASIHPELIRTAALPGDDGMLESNRLSLSVRPPTVIGPDGIPLEMDVVTGAVLVRERIPPDQVVEYMITARQRSQWERFFLYLDLETMLARDAVRNRRWIAESEEGRRRMVEQYREELRNNTTDGISVIPTDFEIERTQYTSFEGTVTVLQRFAYNNFTELKRYTYYLSMIDNTWTIVDYSVNNLGTE